MFNTRKLLALLLALSLMLGSSFSLAMAEEAAAAEEPAEAFVPAELTSEAGVYTYLDYLSSSPTTWNPHTYTTVDDGYIMDYNTIGLYGFDFDPAHPAYGYTVMPEMAAELPVDVTAEYAGKVEWNVPADAEKGYAYKIALNEKAVWEDGTPINADTYIYSMQQQLNPKMQNYRADSYYTGDLTMTRAKDYVYQGSTKPIPLSEYISREGLEGEEALLAKVGTEPGFVNWSYSFGERFDTEKGEWTKDDVKNEVVNAGVDVNRLRELFIEKVTSWGEPEEKAVQFFQDEGYTNYTFPEVAWEKVGLQKTGDYEITLILDKPLVGFYLYYNLGGNWIVKEDLYEANKREVEGNPLVTSTYGTSVETTMGYGPYKLVQFQDDKVIELVKNDKWYGYTDGRHEGRYQTTRIFTQIVKENATQLQMFLSGQLDQMNLSSDQVSDYRGSDFIYYTLSQFTGNLFMQADKAKLEARQEEGFNKTILTLKDFRKAMAWSIDRQDFAATTTSSSSAGFGLLNSRYIADVDNIIPYRNYDQAKETLLKVYGLEYGEGKDYATLDDAYTAMTGYDLDSARKLFDAAYDQAIAEGLMKEGDIVKLVYSTSEDSESTRKTYNYLRDNWTKAMEGTKLEGKFEMDFDATAGNEFSKNFRNGLSDLLIAGWSGAAFNPFYFMLAYLDDNYRYAVSFDPSVSLTLAVDGKDVTLTAAQWYSAMMGDDPEHPYGPDKADMDTRLNILAMLEAAVLEDYTSAPLTYGSTATLKSHKIEYYIEEFNELMGRGGLQYLSYNYDDAEWAAYLDENNGTLDYK